MSSSAQRDTERILPSERLIPRRQLLMIDAMAQAGGTTLPAMPPQDIAGLVGVSTKTVTRSTSFLQHTGLLRAEHRSWALTELGHELARLRIADTARARLLLRDHWQGRWFHTLALQQLSSGPMEDQKLASALAAGLPGPVERGLFLTEWMTYALLLDRDENQRFVLPVERDTPPRAPQSEQVTAFSVLDPLLTTPDEQIAALPDDDFIALMGAYRTVFAALTSQP
ncbi:hypothetical protein ACF09E_30675 [Streptomyces sp. NPDC014891]|uniref:hypothetical protein n=1 Tax=Streptomyces sp. NPDC014891 TaxID=3364929 RepID=UPI0037015F61